MPPPRTSTFRPRDRSLRWGVKGSPASATPSPSAVSAPWTAAAPPTCPSTARNRRRVVANVLSLLAAPSGGALTHSRLASGTPLRHPRCPPAAASRHPVAGHTYGPGRLDAPTASLPALLKEALVLAPATFPTASRLGPSSIRPQLRAAAFCRRAATRANGSQAGGRVMVRLPSGAAPIVGMWYARPLAGAFSTTSLSTEASAPSEEASTDVGPTIPAARGN